METYLAVFLSDCRRRRPILGSSMLRNHSISESIRGAPAVTFCFRPAVVRCLIRPGA